MYPPPTRAHSLVAPRVRARALLPSLGATRMANPISLRPHPADTLMSPVSSLLSRRTMRVYVLPLPCCTPLPRPHARTPLAGTRLSTCRDTRSSFKSLPIVLGSSSPARARVLREHGVRATILSPGIDEVAAAPAMPPAQLPLCIAQAKAAALAARVSTPSLVITADQVRAHARTHTHTHTHTTAREDGVALRSRKRTPLPPPTHATWCLQLLMDGEDRVYSKPTGEADAVRMLASYGGRALRTVTAVVVLNTETGRSVSGVDVATIHFKPSLATAELSAATLAPALPVPLSTLPTVSARLQRHSVGTAAELAEPPSSAPAASSAAQRALPAWQEAPSTVPVDVLQSCGALCVEHPTIAPHIQLIEGELESVLGMPWRLTSRLLREASGVVAFSWESPDASAADASGAYSSRSADGSVG
ncbi:hypothetical protein EON67_08955, partial [archaeon]